MNLPQARYLHLLHSGIRNQALWLRLGHVSRKGELFHKVQHSIEFDVLQDGVPRTATLFLRIKESPSGPRTGQKPELPFAEMTNLCFTFPWF